MPERSSVTIQVTRLLSISAKARLLNPLHAGISVTLLPPLFWMFARFESSNIIGRDAQGLSEVTPALVRGLRKEKGISTKLQICVAIASRKYQTLQIRQRIATIQMTTNPGEGPRQGIQSRVGRCR